jgi:RNA polymerase sigma factor (sigma-70 family)
VSGPATDIELVARVLATHDGAAFAELARRHQAGVRRLLWRLTSGHANADDLAQDTFLRAYRGLASYRGGSFPAWLYRIAYNTFVSAARTGRLAPPHAHDDAGDDAADTSSSALKLDLEAALARLRPEERVAVALTLGQDITHDDAARILGWPLGTLKSHVARGRGKLVRMLQGWKDER